MHHITYQLLRNKVYDYEDKAERERFKEITEWFGAERVSKFFDSC
jgi:hypothetical protein